MAKAPIIHPYFKTPIEPVPAIEVEKWQVRWNLDPEYGRGSRQIQLAWWWPRAKGHRFGYDNTYYDGVHKSITVGPINLYWNW